MGRRFTTRHVKKASVASKVAVKKETRDNRRKPVDDTVDALQFQDYLCDLKENTKSVRTTMEKVKEMCHKMDDSKSRAFVRVFKEDIPDYEDVHLITHQVNLFFKKNGLDEKGSQEMESAKYCSSTVYSFFQYLAIFAKLITDHEVELANPTYDIVLEEKFVKSQLVRLREHLMSAYLDARDAASRAMSIIMKQNKDQFIISDLDVLCYDLACRSYTHEPGPNQYLKTAAMCYAIVHCHNRIEKTFDHTPSNDLPGANTYHDLVRFGVRASGLQTLIFASFTIPIFEITIRLKKFLHESRDMEDIVAAASDLKTFRTLAENVVKTTEENELPGARYETFQSDATKSQNRRKGRK